jgi:phage portal protein BeeE
MLSEGEGAFVVLPQLSFGVLSGAEAFAVKEGESASGQVLLLGGGLELTPISTSAVHLVNLATGTCTP